VLLADNPYFHHFDTDIKGLELPETFTFPFFYTPHPLVELAAMQLQSYMESLDIESDFGYDDTVTHKSIGKMFGVLVVTNPEGDIGFLAAFSGRLADTYQMRGFVPPLFDNVEDTSFYKQGENKVSEMTRVVERLEANVDYRSTLANIGRRLRDTT